MYHHSPIVSVLEPAICFSLDPVCDGAIATTATIYQLALLAVYSGFNRSACR
ncbi:MAG: hypothetical protein ACFB8W_00525 [Elainellaceae cyanobacterium]